MLKLKIFMIGLFLALVGCDANVSAKEAATSSANTVEKHAKPGAGIKLLNPQPFFVTSPGVENLELQLATTADNGILQIDLTASEGLELVSTQAHYEFQLEKKGTYKLPVQISTMKQGRYYLNIKAKISTDSEQKHRALAAIVQVGEPAAKMLKNSASKAPTDHESIIEMPASEKITPAK